MLQRHVFGGIFSDELIVISLKMS